MDVVKMAHHTSHTSHLPSIHGESPTKLADIHSEGSPGKVATRLSARSNYNNNLYNTSRLESLLPQVDSEDAVDLGRIRLEKRSHKQHLPPSVRHMAGNSRVRSGQFVTRSLSPNFDPLPYQPQYFKSSTLMKMVPIPKRHQDMFFDKTPVVPREKPVIIHSERYHFSEPLKPGFERLSQHERLAAEQQYMIKLKQQKLAREVLPHREEKDLLMGGQRARFSERFNVKDELRRLKAIVLPVNARELYHGKGISLPANHSSIKPRLRMPPPLPAAASPEPEEELVKEAALYRHTKTSLDGLKPKKAYNKPKQIKSKVDNHNDYNSVKSQPTGPEKASLSRKSTESNLTGLILPEDDVFPDLPPSPSNMDSDTDYVRAVSRETMQPSTLPIRAESEMDIVLPKETETIKSAKSHPKTPLKAPTPNPLKAADLTLYDISEVELKAVFQRLDTDKDGHLMYPQVEPQLPTNINSQQKKYLKQIYDITSASTFFGVSEFVTMKCLAEEISHLDHELIMRGYEKLNLSTLTTSVIQYTELFQQVDRMSKGKVALSSLEDILCSALQRDKNQIAHGLEQIRDVLKITGNDINKVKFIAGIPYFNIIPTLERPVTTEEDGGA